MTVPGVFGGEAAEEAGAPAALVAEAGFVVGAAAKQGAVDPAVQARGDDLEVGGVEEGEQALVRGGQEHQAAGLEHAEEFAQDEALVGDVLDDFEDEDGVEGVGVERERGVRLYPDGAKAVYFRGVGERLVIDFRAPVFLSTVDDAGGEHAASAAVIQHFSERKGQPGLGVGMPAETASGVLPGEFAEIGRMKVHSESLAGGGLRFEGQGRSVQRQGNIGC